MAKRTSKFGAEVEVIFRKFNLEGSELPHQSGGTNYGGPNYTGPSLPTPGIEYRTILTNGTGRNAVYETMHTGGDLDTYLKSLEPAIAAITHPQLKVST